VDKDKQSRAYAVTPLLEAGRVAYPVNASWASDFIDTLASFPNALHDDDVDAFTGALEYLARGGGNLGMLDWLREEILAAEQRKQPHIA
jgi:phage terminase large subunit-like protein